MVPKIVIIWSNDPFILITLLELLSLIRHFKLILNESLMMLPKITITQYCNKFKDP